MPGVNTLLESALTVLGLDSEADRAAVSSAYRRLAHRIHPDVCAAPGAAQRFDALARAYRLALALTPTTEGGKDCPETRTSSVIPNQSDAARFALTPALLFDPGITTIPPTATATPTGATARTGSSQTDMFGLTRATGSPIVAGPVHVNPTSRASRDRSVAPGTPNWHSTGGCR